MKTLLYEDQTVEQFRSSLVRSRKFHLASGLISNNGLSEIESALTRCLQKGAHGRVLVGADMPTHPDAIRTLRRLENTYKNQIEFRRFQSSQRHIFHVKLAIFEDGNGKKTAILGSSNLTQGGLIGNYEANVFIDNKTLVNELLDYFDEQFLGGYSRRIDDYWFDNYLAWWKEREKAERRLWVIRERVRKIKARRKLPEPLPRRLKESVLAFTGKIEDWPRDGKLYLAVRRRGGKIVTNANSIRTVDFLVHGAIQGGRRTTRKLRGARRYGIPTISEDEFFVFDRK